MLYQSIKHRAEQTLSSHLPNSTKGHILPYHDMSRDKNPQRENKMDSLSFESFHAQLYCKLTYSNTITAIYECLHCGYFAVITGYKHSIQT